MNAASTTDPILRPENYPQIDTTDHVRVEREARSIVEETSTQQRRRIRGLLTASAVLAPVGPAVLALAMGVSAAESFHVLLLTVVPVACAYFLLRPR